MSRRQGCMWVIATLFLLVLAAGIILFRWASQRVNPAGFIGEGSVAEVSVPAGYPDNMFIALHGSRDRHGPVGYKVMRVPSADGSPAGAPVDFATGWLETDGKVSGRWTSSSVPTVSDDKGGFIYRISYTNS